MIVFRNTRRHLAVLFFLALASCVLLGGCGGGGGETKGEGDPDLLISILEGSGMMVAEGMPVQLDVQDLFCRGLLPSGYANNASTPYITFQLGETPGIAPTEFTWLYRLRQDEAVLLVGRTPPKSAYFSLQTFSALRWLEDKGYTGRIFALFGDAINHMTIRSQGSNAPFDSCFALISTGNKTTADRVRRALLEAGYGEGTVNVETIPDELVRFGHDERSDQLNFLYRIALVEDAEEEQRYYETLGGLRVFRLTPDEPQAPAPFPVSILRPKGSGSTELSLLPSLNSLEEALIDTYSGYEPEKLPTAPWFLEGYEPIIQNIDALAATNDTTYLKTPPFSLGEGDFVIAYGVQHPSTGKAVYNSVVAYGWTLLEDLPDEPRFEGVRELLGVAAIDSLERFTGSARRYLPNDPQADMFYAVKIAKSTSGQEADMLIPQPACGRLKMRELVLAFRAYCEPQTKTGPSYSEILFDRAILFKHR